MNERLATAVFAYARAFGLEAPQPFTINDDALADVLERAIAAGKPVPEDFDFWRELPPDGVA